MIKSLQEAREIGFGAVTAHHTLQTIDKKPNWTALAFSIIASTAYKIVQKKALSISSIISPRFILSWLGGMLVLRILCAMAHNRLYSTRSNLADKIATHIQKQLEDMCQNGKLDEIPQTVARWKKSLLLERDYYPITKNWLSNTSYTQDVYEVLLKSETIAAELSPITEGNNSILNMIGQNEALNKALINCNLIPELTDSNSTHLYAKLNELLEKPANQQYVSNFIKDCRKGSSNYPDLVLQAIDKSENKYTNTRLQELLKDMSSDKTVVENLLKEACLSNNQDKIKGKAARIKEIDPSYRLTDFLSKRNYPNEVYECLLNTPEVKEEMSLEANKLLIWTNVLSWKNTVLEEVLVTRHIFPNFSIEGNLTEKTNLLKQLDMSTWIISEKRKGMASSAAKQFNIKVDDSQKDPDEEKIKQLITCFNKDALIATLQEVKTSDKEYKYLEELLNKM